MAGSSHITPTSVSSRLKPAPTFDQLLDIYSSWLFFERHFLLVGRFGVERAIGLIDTVATDNAGAEFHLPTSSELPDYSEPARRAPLILATAGVELEATRSQLRRSR
jgi:hypothetical protein